MDPFTLQLCTGLILTAFGLAMSRAMKDRVAAIARKSRRQRSRAEYPPKGRHDFL